MNNTFSWSDRQERWNTFLIVRPFLTRLITDDERAELEQHGCNVAIYPHREYPMGHMITCPPGTRMQSITVTQHQLHFPDSYHCTLLVVEGWYQLSLDTKHPNH